MPLLIRFSDYAARFHAMPLKNNTEATAMLLILRRCHYAIHVTLLFITLPPFAAAAYAIDGHAE